MHFELGKALLFIFLGIGASILGRKFRLIKNDPPSNPLFTAQLKRGYVSIRFILREMSVICSIAFFYLLLVVGFDIYFQLMYFSIAIGDIYWIMNRIKKGRKNLLLFGDKIILFENYQINIDNITNISKNEGIGIIETNKGERIEYCIELNSHENDEGGNDPVFEMISSILNAKNTYIANKREIDLGIYKG